MAKIVYKDGDNVRALRGIVTKEDDFFVYINHNGNEIRIGKPFIFKIEEGNDG